MTKIIEVLNNNTYIVEKDNVRIKFIEVDVADFEDSFDFALQSIKAGLGEEYGYELVD